MNNKKIKCQKSIFVSVCITLFFLCNLNWSQTFCSKEGIIKLDGLLSTYCLCEKRISFIVENISKENLWIGINVEKRSDNETWFEFCPDIHQKRAITRSMLSFQFPQNSVRQFIWEPRKAGSLFKLETGEYRIVAYINRKDEAPGRKVVLGEFALIKCPR